MTNATAVFSLARRHLKETIMRIFAVIVASALSIAVAAPALAQYAMSSGAMDSGSAMKMSPMAMKKMNKCKAMSHDMMMKNAGCMKMMKMHPDMMKGENMMPGH